MKLSIKNQKGFGILPNNTFKPILVTFKSDILNYVYKESTMFNTGYSIYDTLNIYSR